MSARSVLKAGLLAATMIVPTAPVHAGDWTPKCNDSWVLWTVKTRFAASHGPFLAPRLTIADFGTPRQDQFTPGDKTHSVERRHCSAAVVTSDGVSRQLYYLIESNMAQAGFGSGVEFCASGLDPSHIYGAACASLR